MKIELENKKAKEEIRKLQKDFSVEFNYSFVGHPSNTVSVSLEQEEFSINNIVSKLKTDEDLIFFLNDGFSIKTPYDIDKELAGSIYWHSGGITHIRIGSTKDTIKNWAAEYCHKKSLQRHHRIAEDKYSNNTTVFRVEYNYGNQPYQSSNIKFDSYDDAFKFIEDSKKPPVLLSETIIHEIK